MAKKDLTFAEEKRLGYVKNLFTSILVAACFIFVLQVFFIKIDSIIKVQESGLFGYSFVKNLAHFLFSGLAVFLPLFIYNLLSDKRIKDLFKPTRLHAGPSYFILGTLSVSGMAVAVKGLSSFLISYMESIGFIFEDRGPVFGGNPVVFVIMAAIIPSFFHEITFRGIVVENLKDASRFGAIFVSSLIYSLSFISLQQIPYTFVCGLILSWLYIKSESIAVTLTAQVVTNGILAILWVLEKSPDKTVYNSLLPNIAVAGALIGISSFLVLMKITGFTKKQNETGEEKPLSGKETFIGIFGTFAVYVFTLTAVFMIFVYNISKPAKAPPEDQTLKTVAVFSAWNEVS